MVHVPTPTIDTVADETFAAMELEPTVQIPVVRLLKLTVRPVAAAPVVCEVAEIVKSDAP
jgi:hypothetical protein